MKKKSKILKIWLWCVQLEKFCSDFHATFFFFLESLSCYVCFFFFFWKAFRATFFFFFWKRLSCYVFFFFGKAFRVTFFLERIFLLLYFLERTLVLLFFFFERTLSGWASTFVETRVFLLR